MSHARWKVLSVAFPFAPVGPAAVGGAERVLAMIDRALVEAGHDSFVIGRAGSRTCGSLIEVPALRGCIDDTARALTYAAVRAAIIDTLRRERIDVVHMHGLDFHEYRPLSDVPVLVTLHLPAEAYPPATLLDLSPGMHMHGVSRAQHRRFPPGMRVLDPVENGVEVLEFSLVRDKARYALVLGRICPEKGQHLALAAASLAGVPLLLAGCVFPYAEHIAYFRDRIAPLLGDRSRFVGTVAGAWRRDLIARARCVLVPSLVEETSSLVVMEAFASGTPVVAMRRGALAELVEHGVTGFLADDVAGLVDGIGRAGEIDRARLRERAIARHDASRMTRDYFARYSWLVERARRARPGDDVADAHRSLTG